MTLEDDLRRQIDDLRARVRESDELVHAIQRGEVDALVVGGPDGDQVYTLTGTDRMYRLFIDAMSEGAVMLSSEGAILYSNLAFSRLMSMPLEEIIGQPFDRFVGGDARRFVVQSAGTREEVEMLAADGRLVTASVSAQPVEFDGQAFAAVVVTDLSSQRLHERLLKSEERFRRASDAAGALVYDLTLTGTGERATVHGLESVTGLSMDVAQDDGWWDSVIHPDDLAGHRARLAQALAGPTLVWSDSYRIRHVRGDWRTVQDVAEIERGADGRPTRLIGTVLDVTERAAAECALRESAERLQIATEAAGIGTFEIDLVERRVRRSDQVAAMLGRSGQTELSLEDALLDIHPHERDRVLKALFEGIDPGSTGRAHAEAPVIRGDGSIAWLEWTTQTLFEETTSGRMPRRVIGAVRDTTERTQREAALRESEGRFRLMADQTPIIVWVTDPAGGIDFVNRSYCDFFGVTMPAVRDTGWTPLLHPDDEAYADAFFAALRSRSEFRAQARARNAVGEWRWIDSVGIPRYSPDDRFLGMIGTTRDVTDERRANQREREAARQKDEFIAVLAHELRNPLAPIRTAVGLLRTRELSPSTVMRCRDIIERQVAQMARLLDDLLDVSRLSRGQLTLQPGATRLADIVEAAVETARPSIDDRGHTLRVGPIDPAIVLDADSTRLTQVFANLLNNAAKYTDRGGLITLTCASDRDRVEVSIVDTGVGIDADMQDRIFELFTQTPDSRARADGGVGIGLGLARRLVEMHGGTIAVASRGRGHGSTFTVTLRTSAREAPPEPRALATFSAGAATLHCRVLVADDNVDAAEMMALLLGTMGCEVRTVYDGGAAVREAQDFRPDLLLLDLGMPGVTGQAACRQIRAEAWGGHAVIAAVTGWAQEVDRRQTALAGFDHHFTKPVDPDALLQLVLGLESERGGRRARGS